ncbi:MAG: Holliday junction resolvase RuvX [Microbacteriaceae bacterium]
MRSGVRLGIDVGKARIGLAKSDASGSLAVPIATISARVNPVLEVLKYLGAFDVMEVVIGLPMNLQNQPTPSTQMAKDFAEQLAEATTIPIRLLDERFSTVTAQAQLHQAGRNAKNSRSVIDQAAAVIILQTALDQERQHGTIPGSLVENGESDT